MNIKNSYLNTVASFKLHASFTTFLMMPLDSSMDNNLSRSLCFSSMTKVHIVVCHSPYISQNLHALESNYLATHLTILHNIIAATCQFKQFFPQKQHLSLYQYANGCNVWALNKSIIHSKPFLFCDPLAAVKCNKIKCVFFEVPTVPCSSSTRNWSGFAKSERASVCHLKFDRQNWFS